MFPILLLFFLIFIFICIIRKETVATKIDKVISIVFLVAALFALPISINDGIVFFQTYNILNEFTTIWIALLAILAPIMVFLVVVILIGVRIIERAFLVFRRPSVIITQTKNYSDRKLFFKVTIQGRFSQAFVKTTIKDKYDQEKIFLNYYDPEQKVGKIFGKILFKTDGKSKEWRCLIPEEFEQGIPEISVEVINTIPVLFSWVLNDTIGDYNPKPDDSQQTFSGYIQ